MCDDISSVSLNAFPYALQLKLKVDIVVLWFWIISAQKEFPLLQMQRDSEVHEALVPAAEQASSGRLNRIE